MFCSECGEELLRLPPVQCTGCGMEHWRNAKPCSGALVTRGDELLLVRRTIEPWNGLWDVPGGFCEAEEHPEAAALREVFEETGFRIELKDMLGIWLDRYDEPRPGTRHPVISLCIYYVAAPIDEGGAPLDAAEVGEVGWFAASALPERMAFPNHVYEVFDAWRRWLRAAGGGGR